MPQEPPSAGSLERPAGEFDLIARHLARLGAARADVALGVGDDAALLAAPDGAGICAEIFSDRAYPGSDPGALARRALAEPAARIRARGADPAWATLALTLPDADEAWLAALAREIDVAARESGIAVVGGDTTRGPARLTVCVLGLLGPAP